MTCRRIGVDKIFWQGKIYKLMPDPDDTGSKIILRSCISSSNWNRAIPSNKIFINALLEQQAKFRQLMCRNKRRLGEITEEDAEMNQL